MSFKKHFTLTNAVIVVFVFIVFSGYYLIFVKTPPADYCVCLQDNTCGLFWIADLSLYAKPQDFRAWFGFVRQWREEDPTVIGAGCEHEHFAPGVTEIVREKDFFPQEPSPGVPVPLAEKEFEVLGSVEVCPTPETCFIVENISTANGQRLEEELRTTGVYE